MNRDLCWETKSKWQLVRIFEATACIQSTVLSPLFYESITYEQLIFYLSINFQGHLNLEYISYIWTLWVTSMNVSSIIPPWHTHLIYYSFIAANSSYKWNAKQVNFPVNVNTFFTYRFLPVFLFPHTGIPPSRRELCNIL